MANINDSCAGKFNYESFSAANKAARNQRKRRDVASKPYKCKFCSYFHIGQTLNNTKRVKQINFYEQEMV